MARQSDYEVDHESPEKSNSRLVKENAVAGLASGVTGTVIGYPLDLVKTRMQMSSVEHTKSLNLFQISASILRQEGPRAFFKGLGAPLVSISFISTVTFSCYTWFRHQLGAERGWDVRNAMAAMACAPVTAPITTIEGLIRTQMQVDNIHRKQFTGSWQCLTTLTRLHGPFIVTKGTTITVSRDAAYLCGYFFVYEGMKATLEGRNNYLSTAPWLSVRPEIAVPLAGGTSGAVAWLCSFPFDCVRAGVQGQNLEIDKNNPTRKTGRQVFRDIMQSKGIRALYRGVLPTVSRAFVVSATRFSAYEATLWFFRRNRDH